MSTLKHTTTAARFGWFALSHFLISITTCAVFFFGAAPLSLLWSYDWSTALVPAVWTGMTVLALGSYFAVGAYIASTRRWSRPSCARERILAVLLPTLVAWCWEGIAIAGMSGDAAAPLSALAGFLLYAALSLATPSVVFIFFSFSCLHVGPWLDDWRFWVTAALAGLLPPLLFAAGSFWQSRRKRHSATTEK